MSKADQPVSTAASASKSRRAVILSAGGIAAAGAFATVVQPLPVMPAPFSAEFLEYRRCVQAHIEACDVEEPDFGTPELDAWDAATSAACEARHKARLVIQNRPIRSRQDFAELAQVVREELWQQEPDGTWHAHSINHELEDALMRAVFALVDGGAANV